MLDLMGEFLLGIIYIVVFTLALPPAVVVVSLCYIGVILRWVYANIISFPFLGWAIPDTAR